MPELTLFFICLGKSAARYAASNAGMIKFNPAGTETGLNISKALPVGRLREGHA